MNVSSINCTPIKPQVAFGMATEENYRNALESAKQMNDTFVESNDIKTPLQTVAAVGFAGLQTFIKGAATFALVDKITKGNVSKFIKNTGKSTVKVLNNVSNSLKGGASNKARTLIAAGSDKIASAIKTVGKNVKLPVLAGVAAMAALVPVICSRDNNEDGVKDIAQKSQSAYKAADKKMNKLVDDTSTITKLAIELAQIFS